MQHKLSPLKIGRITKAGMYADGGGLYLQVAGADARSWVYRYTLNGRQRYLGLGPASAIPLARARELAAAARQSRAEGLDPIDKKHEQRAASRRDDARAVTFKDCGERYIATHEPAWRNPKHRQQWRNTLDTYAYPVFGSVSVADVDVGMVMKVIEPLWAAKRETAGRLRGRIEAVLDWAKARGFRDGENPARWRGHLSNLLPARSKAQAVKHHAALPYEQLPAFMADLRSRTSISAKALEITILCALRTSEVIGGTWNEIDLVAGVWTLPGGRMKAGQAHRVPLAPRVLEILCELSSRREGEWVFPGNRAGKPLSNMALLKMLAVMGHDEITTHGFRATFKTWASERSSFANEIVESALAHAVGSKVEQAYQRSDRIEKRRRLMFAWADYAGKPPATSTVVPLRPAG
jgi:integrase